MPRLPQLVTMEDVMAGEPDQSQSVGTRHLHLDSRGRALFEQSDSL